MTHFLLLLVVSVLAYVAWQASDPKERQGVRALITRHGGRLAAILVVLFALLGAAAKLPSSPIL